MKKLYLQILISLFILTTVSFAQTKWYANSKATFTSNPNSIYFVTENEGWVCGNDGLIAYTKDGGINWEKQNSTTTNTLRNIQFLNNLNGWIAGDARTLLKTTDGGKNWSTITVSTLTDSKQNIYKARFFDNNTGFLVASKSNISSTEPAYVIKTSDGGATWTTTLTTTKSILAMSFASSSNGIVTGKDTSIIFYTTNGGSEWKKSSTPTDFPQGINYSRSDLWGCFMVNNNIAYATGWGSSAAGLQPTIYLKSTDGGKTWKYLLQQVANRSYDNNKDIYFKDENNGIAVGGSATLGGWVYKTTDGGINWIIQPLISATNFSEISVVGNQAYLLGGAGNIFKTADWGTTLSNLTKNGISLGTISFPSANVGYAGGISNGIFLKTTNGGKTWLSKSLLFPATPKGKRSSQVTHFFFINENVGYCANRNSVYTKTTDGGNSWNVLLEDTLTTHTFNSSYFINENTGWVVGRYAGSSPNYNYAIYKISDGNTLTLQKTGSNELSSINFANSNIGIAVGKAGSILYTTDGGSTWSSATSSFKANLNDVKFLNPLIAVVVGDTGVVGLSLDAGKTWLPSPMPVPKYSYNSMTVKDNTTGYISGYYNPAGTIKGTILQVTLSGLNINVTDQTDTTLFENNLTAITADPSGNIWAVATSNSLIFSTKQVTKVDPTFETYKNYNLSQNYPNPFNPSTKIQWNMKKSGLVEIKVYDLLGKEVKTLVNKLYEPGNHLISWDGRNGYENLVSSGIYYYRIKVNDFVNVKKMMYLR